MNWEMLGALTGVAALINALGWFVIDMRIDSKLQSANEKLKDELMDRINGRYIRSDLYSAKHDALIIEIARKVDRAECIHRQSNSGPISNH